jgi:carboxyl-terminal processing protease
MGIGQNRDGHEGFEDIRQLPIRRPKRSFLRFCGMLALAAMLFSVGFLIGDDRIKINGLGSTLQRAVDTSGASDDLSTDGLQEIYDKLRQNYDGEVSNEELLDGLKKGVVAAVGDSYTEYLSEEEATEFAAGLDGKFEGIGAELASENGFIIIVAPIKGTPAERAGLQPQDVIVEINGEPATDISVFEAVKRIRGEKGTEVTLTIVREGESTEVKIIRDTIDIPSAEWRVEDGIGIIEIGQFNKDTTNLVEKAAKEFNGQGIKKVILDVRGNPGGLLDQAIGVSNIWLKKGDTVLLEKNGDEVIETFKARENPIFAEDVQTIVLINEGSASASEIVAGALKDNNRAKLMGETSFGKGSVQQVIELEGGGALKVTIARWYTPGDKNIDKEGIKPDVEVKRTTEDIKNKLDPQLEAAKTGF